MRNKIIKLAILNLFICILFSANILIAEELIISVEESVYNNFKKWTFNTSPYEITKFNTIYSDKGTVELILLHQALKASEIDFEIKLIPTKNNRKERYLVSQGIAHIAAQCLWEKNINKNDFSVSTPVLSKGEYEKGVYAYYKNRPVFKAKTVEELRKFKAIVLKSDNPDLKTLKAMDIKSIEVVSDLKKIYRSLFNKKTDFVLLDFSENNKFNRSMKIKVNKKYKRRTVKITRNVKLYPVKNIKIGLQGQLHYITTKKGTDSEKIFDALEKGIKALKEKKIFKKAFVQSGCINYRVVDWKQIF
ncbi:MAG: hypothetical protein GY714_26740 [Desulfobacterales bacterium]|nr:hypothetical protein [Desulfobacterales bacterium]MCP4161954.1 hypothetical protein [Deltaproteobacteria bacterium]